MSIPILAYLHAASCIVPVVVGLSRYRLLDRSMKVLTWLATLTMADWILQYVLGRLKVNNLFVATCFIMIEFVMISWIYWLENSNRRVRQLVSGSFVLFLLIFAPVNVLERESSLMNDELEMVSRVILVALSLLTLQQSSESGTGRITSNSVYWVAIGVILYSAGTFIVVGTASTLLRSDPVYFVAAWHVNWAMLIAANILYAKALSCPSRMLTR